MTTFYKSAITVGLVAVLAGTCLFKAGLSRSVTPSTATGSGTPAAALVPLAPTAEPAPALAAPSVVNLSVKEIESRLREIDEDFFSAAAVEKMNAGTMSAQERESAAKAFAEKNALFARWADLKIAKYEAAVKKIEAQHVQNVERAKGEINESAN